MSYSPTAPRAELDMTLFWSVALLLSIGLVMVYSSSITMAEADKYSDHSMHYYLRRQALFVLLGLVAGFITFQIPIALWQRLALPLFMIGGFLLVIVIIPGVSPKINGAHRWIRLGFMNFQPSELMKFIVVLYAADYTVRKAAFMNDFKKGFLPMLSVMFFMGAMLQFEPDYGALVVTTTIAMAILFLGGMNWRIFMGLLILLATTLTALVVYTPYRLKRVDGFINPWKDEFDTSYQLTHSLMAIGRGEWFGVGLGGSVEKLFYLTEAHTDFIFAIIAEELGFVGVAAVIALFVLLVFRAFAVGREAMMREKYFASLVAQGIGVWLGIQAIINMGVNMGALPTKGLTLPFISYGGTGILVNCVAIAVLLRIDAENRAGKRPPSAARAASASPPVASPAVTSAAPSGAIA